ncbi:hypothetical protein CCAN2_1710010 [Capnocytophaga canimorsus]|nr:hypothetical protein CCAN2_1710010 [Capnocytophaga canimorsus]
MVMYPTFFGIQGDEIQATVKAMKVSFITVGIWWIVFSQYSFYYLPSFKKKGRKIKTSVIFDGHKELLGVLEKYSKQTQELKGFLFAFFIYSMGVQNRDAGSHLLRRTRNSLEKTTNSVP